MSAKARRSSTFTFDTAVEIDAADVYDALLDEGWHHEEDCPAKKQPVVIVAAPVREAITTLHQQAHPDQNPLPELCRMEPCRSLSLTQLQAVAAA